MRDIVNIYTETAGVKQTPGAKDDNGTPFTLAAGTYYAELFEDVSDRSLLSVHYKWDGALVATITAEASNRSTVTSYPATGSGWATTGATTISPAASASEVVQHWADFVAARARIKIVVGTQGVIYITEHGKSRGGL